MFYPVSWNHLQTLTHTLSTRIVSLNKDHDVIVAIARGGLSIANILSDILHLPVSSFTVSTYNNMEKLAHPELVYGVAQEIKGKRVLLLDDIADTGETLEFGKRYLLECGAEDVTTVSLFFKHSSRIVPDCYAKQVSEWVIFPFEIKETLNTLKQMQQSDPVKAKDLADAISNLELPNELVESLNKDLT